MTPAMLAHKIWTTRRGVGLLLTAMMLAVGVLLYIILASVPQRAQVVDYGSAVYTPDKPSYCPGDTMTYHVRVVVRSEDLPALLRVVEAWHREADGITLQSTARTFELPLVRPVDVQTVARRAVPDLAPGVYWLDHVSQNGSVAGYTVGPVTIEDCP